MRVITTHTNTDFDGFASMVAASKLYPGSTMVFPGRVNDNVKEFTSLYKDVFEVKKISRINLDKIDELIIVDTQQSSRLGALAACIERIPRIIIFDHHSVSSEEAIESSEQFVDSTASTVTLLMEIIIRGDIEINPFEATLFALGLYEDTGCFTFSSTSVREIKVLKYLAERGLDFNVIREFIGRSFSEKQKYLLEMLLNNTEVYELKGIRAALSTGETKDDIRGLSVVVSQLMDIQDADLMVAAVKMGDKFHLVARNISDRINLKEILKAYGGRGHENAASAVIKEFDLKGFKGRLLKDINRLIKPSITAMDIMSFPVRSVSLKDTVDDAWWMLVKYGHSGLPVVQQGRLEGIISRRDLEKAKHHGLGHAPVKGFMSKKVQTVRTDTPFKEIEEIMVEYDIGRLPVADDRGKLLGIVTRTDVLKTRHNKKNHRGQLGGGRGKQLKNFDDLNKLINTRLPKKIQGLLFLLGQKADSHGCRLYVVGGFVRDLILGKNNFDIDLVVEPNAIDFARELNRFLDGRIIIYEQFGTAKIILKDGLRLDFAAARTEFYLQPGAVPQVELSNIRQDLYRRDFTINTLAFQLNIEQFGLLLDFFGGVSDLEQKIIRVLYNLSFVEDPLRIIRAARFEQRLDFNIEEETLSFIENSIKTKVINKVSRDRLAEEISLIFKEKEPHRVIMRLQEFKLIPYLFPKLNFEPKHFRLLMVVQKVLEYFINEIKIVKINRSIPYLCALYYYNDSKDLTSILYQMKLKKEVRENVHFTLEKTPELLEILSKPNIKPSRVYKLLEPLPLESMIFLSACSDNMRTWGYIKAYLEKFSSVTPYITGEDLKELGYSPGPLFKEVLEELKMARLDGLVKSRDEEVRLVIQYMARGKGGD
ncbi:CBS domain-containing protein [Candidatus Contubernalis alkaliaceticus]|uniref:CBS domain-containing protein n=1 Tax=Candidatus Contubernalis alkaliaceticus TaxID=338645 RepID=UPI001F4C516F|nr:CBS domain-containing protein [Candidatus Contubernalis alkalaceticus]UNC92513.1 CBS domain-containing protein [Candidatus Contubernalis alkalaceticus]